MMLSRQSGDSVYGLCNVWRWGVAIDLIHGAEPHTATKSNKLLAIEYETRREKSGHTG